MKFERFAAAVLAVTALLGVFVSCKKDDEDETLPSISGSLYFKAPSYAAPGTTLSMTPKGAVHPDGGSLGYYWAATGVVTKADTTRLENDPESVTGEFSLVVPDSLYTMKITCVAFAEGYTNTYAYSYVTVVKDESVTGIEHPDDEKSFTDARDGKVYTYVSHDGLDWMNTNLQYASAGRPYTDCEAMTPVFGNLYTWEEANVSCPDGWRLPTEDEVKSLCGGSFKSAAGSLMVDAYFNGDRMWDYWPDVNVTNSTGMNMYPCGYAYYSGTEWGYKGIDDYSVIWTSTAYDDEQMKYLAIYESLADLTDGNAHKDSFAVSVRCVREAE